MVNFRTLFKNKCSIIGMIHLAALPVGGKFKFESSLEGTPKYQGSIQNIIDRACKEIEIYLRHNIDGILVENMNDVPYVQSKFFQPETVAVMSRVCTEIRKMAPSEIACGVQVLACGNKEALAIAQACNFNFIRAEGFVFSHIADEGFTDACAGQILRYRKQLGAEDTLVFADIKKKHSSHSITRDVSLVETAKAAELFLSDGIILTGTSTGVPADRGQLEELKCNVELPVIIGSGVTQENVHHYLKADALIIGSFFKEKGLWSNCVDERIVSGFMDYVHHQRAVTS